MRTPGIGVRNKRFKGLVGRGKKKNGRKQSKRVTKKRDKVSRKLRTRRTEKHRNKNVS